MLSAVGSTSNSVTLSWRTGDTGGSPITQLTLTWRPDPGEWREILLPRHASQYTLSDLTCGTTYHLYITPHNSIGKLWTLKPL